MSLVSIFTPGRPAFIPYVMAGDPDLETTRLILAALARANAGAIELGIPYGDPLADGATIAAAGTRALANGTRIADVLALVKLARDAGGPPIVLFTYFNPIYRYGLEAFALDAAAAGAAGALVPDIALEESDELRATLAKHGLEMPLMVAPSTPRDRAAIIAAASGGFVYVVSRLGVTGAGAAPDFSPLHGQVAMLREVTDKPLAVGFGVSTPAHVAQVAPLVDGIIVGSALIDAYAGTSGREAAAAVERFVGTLFG
ncbi:MAG TPA: tryptophan synthase subunit alpha [Candidatus Baltobacteraceae bacterium]